MKRFRISLTILFCAIFISQNYAQVSTFPYSEGFETSFGEWQQYTGDDFDWDRNENGTPSFLTGPSAAFEGTWYAYAEANGNNNDNAGLYAEFNFNSAGLTEPKFEFYYHMYNGFTLFGDQMGTLNVYVSTDGGSSWTNLWNITGNQGNLWHKVIINLSAYSSFDNVYIGFMADIGSGNRSDIAIDDINVYEPVFNCVSIPYYQDFNASGVWPTDWSTDNASTWTISTDWEGSSPPTGNHVYGTISGSSNGNVYSTCFDVISNTNIHVRFYHYWQATTGLFAFQDGTFYGSPDGGVTIYTIDQWDVGTATEEGWQEYDISSWADGASRLLFWWEVSGGFVFFGTDGYWNIDDFGIQEGSWSYQYTWTGAASSDWNNPNNWDSGFTPDENIDVIIPGGAPNYPVLIDSLVVNASIGAYRCKSMSIEDGGEVEVYQASDMIVYGNVTIETGGTLFIGDDLQVEYGGNLYIFGGTVTNNYDYFGYGDITFDDGSGGYMSSGSLTVYNYFRFFDGSTWHATGGAVHCGGIIDSIQIIIQNANVFFHDLVVENGVRAILWNTSWYPLYINGDLNLETNAHLRVDPEEILNVAGDAFLSADATGTASLLDNGTFNVSGTTTVQQYLTSEMWHLVSPPISDAEIGIYMNIYLKEYNEPTDTWTYLVNPITMPMNVTQGYSAWASNDLTGPTTVNFAGTLNANVDYPIGSLSYTPSSPASGWNLLGNPYPSPLQWNSLWTKADLSEWACVHNNGNDECYNALTGTGWPLAGSMANGIIPSTQGFWVRATSASASLTIPQSERKYSSQSFYKGSGIEMNETIRLRVDGNDDSDAVLLQFIPGATSGYDPMFDLEKRWGYTESPQIYAIINEDELFSVSVLPKLHHDLIIPIGFEVGVEGSFSLSATELSLSNSITASEMQVVLEDLMENTLTVLTLKDVYQFEATPSDKKHRFNLHFKNSKTDVNDITNAGVNIYSNENIVYVQIPEISNGDIVIYDMMGREVARKHSTGETITRIEVNAGTGYYVVKAQTGDQFVTEKVFIK